MDDEHAPNILSIFLLDAFQILFSRSYSTSFAHTQLLPFSRNSVDVHAMGLFLHSPFLLCNLFARILRIISHEHYYFCLFILQPFQGTCWQCYYAAHKCKPMFVLPVAHTAYADFVLTYTNVYPAFNYNKFSPIQYYNTHYNVIEATNMLPCHGK